MTVYHALNKDISVKLKMIGIQLSLLRPPVTMSP